MDRAAHAAKVPDSAFRGLVPTWKGNLLVFGLLVAVVLAYLYWQVGQAQSAFLRHARVHAGIIAGVIESNADSAVLGQEVVEEIIRTFLGNMARFVLYLDDVEPFSPNELAAFAEEAGLAGIRILKQGGRFTEGPQGWLGATDVFCEDEIPSLQHLADAHLYGLALRPDGGTRCVVVGIAAGRIEALEERIGLPRLLKTVSRIAGISYLRIEPKRPEASEENGKEMGLLEGPDGTVAEARFPMKDGDLVVGIDARQLAWRIARLRQEFMVFAALLAATGLLLSWLLYRLQSAYLGHMRSAERELARQREDAALGRAAASIAHEIRNPLNAISMGLQRLSIEARDPDENQRELIETMRHAVHRTNAIVTDIRRFARPLAPRRVPIRLDEITGEILQLYRGSCEARSVRIEFTAGFRQAVALDPDMMSQAIENLIKNAVEAPGEGGFVRIEIRSVDGWLELSIENSGFTVPEGGTDQILEPYFTTKTRGTGLGLSIAQRIAASHGGRVTVQHLGMGVLRTRLRVPLGGEVNRKEEGESLST